MIQPPEPTEIIINTKPNWNVLSRLMHFDQYIPKKFLSADVLKPSREPVAAGCLNNQFSLMTLLILSEKINKWSFDQLQLRKMWQQLLVFVPGGGQRLSVCLPGRIFGSALWGSEKPLCKQSMQERWPLPRPAWRVHVWMPARLRRYNLWGEGSIPLIRYTLLKTVQCFGENTRLYLPVLHL